MHSHNCDEQVTILEGEAEAEFEGRRHRLHAYDTTLIPANKPHRFVNVGTTPLAILWIYAASEVTRTFAETGETVAHLSERDLASPSSPKGKYQSGPLGLLKQRSVLRNSVRARRVSFV
mgnify:CR=1 FL=1